ncbi:hypothetical protein H0N98_01260 [Candidatus Micrarchaeota archaeon]|nr:hypothetical protein [Candidatus Micrarchaeota archaeon]
MPLITAKSDKINAINDLSKQDDTILYERSKFLIGGVEEREEEEKLEFGRVMRQFHFGIFRFASLM